jgi:hypothetical protein
MGAIIQVGFPPTKVPALEFHLDSGGAAETGEAAHEAHAAQMALQKQLQQWAHPLVHHLLGGDQQWQRHQETGVGLQVPKDRHRDAAADQLPFQSREQQER